MWYLVRLVLTSQQVEALLCDLGSGRAAIIFPADRDALPEIALGLSVRGGTSALQALVACSGFGGLSCMVPNHVVSADSIFTSMHVHLRLCFLAAFEKPVSYTT